MTRATTYREAEDIARAFHEAYERFAPEFGYVTREESATAWEKVPERNKSLMVAVVQELADKGVIMVVDDWPDAMIGCHCRHCRKGRMCEATASRFRRRVARLEALLRQAQA